MEKILGKTPAISNGHQPPQAVDPYVDGKKCTWCVSLYVFSETKCTAALLAIFTACISVWWVLENFNQNIIEAWYWCWKNFYDGRKGMKGS